MFNDGAQQCRWVVNALMISQMEIHIGGKIRTVVLHFMKSLTTEWQVFFHIKLTYLTSLFSLLVDVAFFNSIMRSLCEQSLPKQWNMHTTWQFLCLHVFTRFHRS